MMRDFDDATRAQIEAARPDASTWLTANAGSGKTRVLTDRVARLLLDDVEPQHILCLTYTKAAASEMQNRLFKRLGEWAMLKDEALRDALADLGEKATPAVPALTDLIDDKDQQIWFQSTMALARIGPDAEAAIPKLLGKLGDRDEQRRYRTAYCLGKIGPCLLYTSPSPRDV